MQGPILTDTPPELEAELLGLTLTEEVPVTEASAEGNAAGEDAQTKDGLIRLMDYLKKRQKRGSESTNISRALGSYERVQLGYVNSKGQHYDREC